MRRVLFFLLFLPAISHADDLRVDYVRQSLSATYTHYQQFIDGIAVVGGERIERVDGSGQRDVFESLAAPPASRVAAAAMAPRGGEFVYLNENGKARQALRVIVEERPLQRYAQYYDAATGVLIRSDPLFWSARGRVFDPNPVAKLNAPQLQDQNDSASAVPEAAYSVEDLLDLPPTGMLIGPNVQIVDTQAPFTDHADAGQSLMFDRSQPQFEEVNTYFHIDRSQRYLQSLGYVGARRIVGYSIPVDPHAVNGSDNSLFVSGSVRGQGALFFGDGGTDDAEDSDIMLHEFGHAIQESIAPGAFGGPSSGQPRALGEGFGDYWAFSSNYTGTIASGRDPFCIGDWDARCWNDESSEQCGYPVGADCLRRVDSTKSISDFVVSEAAGTEHRNGEIWSSALREIFLGMTGRYGVEQGRRMADTIVLEATFGTPSSPTFALMARKLLDADRALNRGTHAALICGAMAPRGILGFPHCAPRGELTWFSTTSADVSVADPRPVDTLSVNLSVGGDAQIDLVAPDGTRFRLPDSSGTLRSTVPVDAFRGRPATGTWHLVVSGGGVLNSWALVIKFAGDQPLQARPFSAARKTVPAVAHAAGANGTLFISDVRLFNAGTSPANVVAIFTPSGQDGSTVFGAVKLTLAPGEVVPLDDVVKTTVMATGTGQLELDGDVSDLVATSRTYTAAAAGTFGQSIPAFETSDITSGTATISLLRRTADFRSNIGFAEVAGSSGTAHFTFVDAAGKTVGTADYPIVPFTHFQTALPVDSAAMRADVAVIGSARVMAYGSIVDNHSGDGMFVPAVPAGGAQTSFMPAIHAAGANGTFWRTDLWLTNPSGESTLSTLEALNTAAKAAAPPQQIAQLDDVVRNAFNRDDALIPLTITSTAIAGSRTWTSGAAGTYGEFIPPVTATEATSAGQPPLQLIGIEQTAAQRTNVGIMNPSRDITAAVRLIVFDSAGREIARTQRTLAPMQLIQAALFNITTTPLHAGRVAVEAIGGQVVAYASIVDNITGDPYVIVARSRH